MILLKTLSYFDKVTKGTRFFSDPFAESAGIKGTLFLVSSLDKVTKGTLFFADSKSVKVCGVIVMRLVTQWAVASLDLITPVFGFCI